MGLHVSDEQKFSTIIIYPIIYDLLPMVSTTRPTYPLFSLYVLLSFDRSQSNLSNSIQIRVGLHVSDEQKFSTIIYNPIIYNILPMMSTTRPTYPLFSLYVLLSFDRSQSNLSNNIQIRVGLHVSDEQKFSTIIIYPIIYNILPMMSTTRPTYPLFSLYVLLSFDRSQSNLSNNIQIRVGLHVSDEQKFSTIIIYPIIYDILPMVSTTRPTYPLFSLYVLLSFDRSQSNLSNNIQIRVGLHVSDEQKFSTIIIYPIIYDILSMMSITRPTYPLFSLYVLLSFDRSQSNLSNNIQIRVGLHVSDEQKFLQLLYTL